MDAFQATIKLMSFSTALAAAIGGGLTANWILQPGHAAQAPPAKVQAPAARDRERKLKDDYPFFGDKDREKDFIYAEMGNMRPVIEDAKGVRFQCREAILYKDGTAKLFSLQQKDPIAPTFHTVPMEWSQRACPGMAKRS